MADAAFIGSSGSMVTTTLESLGYYYQSYLLDEVGQTIAGPMGGLIYTVGAIMAMTSFMMTGRYKFWLWFFLGPGIFFLILSSRTSTAGSDWKFGLDIRIRDGVEIEVRNVIDRQGFDFGESAQVSSLFAGFNRVTSRVIGEIVRVLNNGRAKADIRFILRSELSAYMRSQNDMENGLRELLQGTLLRNCERYVEAARASKDVSISDEERTAAEAEFAKIESTRDVRVGEGAVTYITGRLVAGEPVEGFAPVGAASPEEYQQKFDETRQLVRETPLSCGDVWKIVYVGVMENAKRTLQRARDIAKANGMDDAEQRRLEQDFSQLLGMKRQAGAPGPERAEAMAKAIALYTMRNETGSLINSPFIDDYVNRGRTKNLQTPSEKQLSQVERARVENKEWSEKTRAMTTAATLPYYQGVGLLVLSIAFPFFALLLLIPGKHTGFLLWFQLWVWLKSWDIGFAVVMMLDDLLFSIMGTGPAAAPNNVQLPEDFASAIFTLKEIDPTFQMGTYYTLIALALQSIPMITGYLVMGSASAGSSILSAGAQPFADELSGGALSAEGQYHTTGNRYANMSDVLDATERGLANANAGSSEPGIARPIPNPYNGDLNNFLSSISSFEGMRPYGNDPSQVRPWMGYSAGSAERMAADAESERGNAGYLQGIGRGTNDGQDPVSRIQQMIGGGGDILDQLGSGKLNLRSAELEASTHWDRTFVISGPVAQGRVADGRLFNAFEIPQIEGGGYRPEKDAEVARMMETKEVIKSFLMMGNRVFDTGNAVSRSMRRGGGGGAGGAGAAAATAGAGGGATTSGALGALLWMLTPGNGVAAEGPEGSADGTAAPGVTRQALARAAGMTTASSRPARRRTVRRVVRTVTESPMYSDQFPDNGYESGITLDERSVANGGGENYLTRGIYGQSEVAYPVTGVAAADAAAAMQNDLIDSSKNDRAGQVIGAIPGRSSEGRVMLADGSIVDLGTSTPGSEQSIGQIGMTPTQSDLEAFALLNPELNSNGSRFEQDSNAARSGEMANGDDSSSLAANAARGQSLGWSTEVVNTAPVGEIASNGPRSLSSEPTVFRSEVFGEPSDYAGPNVIRSADESDRMLDATPFSGSEFAGVTLSAPSFVNPSDSSPAVPFTNTSSDFGNTRIGGSDFFTAETSVGGSAGQREQRESLSAEPTLYTSPMFDGAPDYAAPGDTLKQMESGRENSPALTLTPEFEAVTLSSPSFSSPAVSGPAESTVYGSSGFGTLATENTSSSNDAFSSFAVESARSNNEASHYAFPVATSNLEESARSSSIAFTSPSGFEGLPLSTSTSIVNETSRDGDITAFASVTAASSSQKAGFSAQQADISGSWASSVAEPGIAVRQNASFDGLRLETPRDTANISSAAIIDGDDRRDTATSSSSGFAAGMQAFTTGDFAASVSPGSNDRGSASSVSWAFSSDSPDFVTARPPEGNVLTGNSWTVAEIEEAQRGREAEQVSPLETAIPVPVAPEEQTPVVEVPTAVAVETVAEQVDTASAVSRRKVQGKSGAARKAATQVIVHAQEAEKKAAPSADVAADTDEAPSAGMAMDESRLTAERERLEQVGRGLIESLKQLDPSDPIATAVSGTTADSLRSVSYRAADGFDRPVVIIDGIREVDHLIIANDDIVRELTAGGQGIIARPMAGAALADPDSTIVVSATEAGTLVGLEQAAELAQRNGNDRGAIERAEEQLDLTRADIAGTLRREFARLDGALEFGALKAQNDYLKEHHERSTFADDEAITRHIAQASGYGKTEYLSNLVERYGASLYTANPAGSGLSDQFIERLPGREVFRDQYIEPLEASAFQYQKDRAAELRSWSITESVNGEPRLTFDTVTALGLGLQTTGAPFEEQKREQQQLVASLSAALVATEQQSPLSGEKIEELRTAFQYTVGADADLRFEDYAKVVQRISNGNAVEAERWLAGDRFEALVREFGKPQGAA